MIHTYGIRSLIKRCQQILRNPKIRTFSRHPLLYLFNWFWKHDWGQNVFCWCFGRLMVFSCSVTLSMDVPFRPRGFKYRRFNFLLTATPLLLQYDCAHLFRRPLSPDHEICSILRAIVQSPTVIDGQGPTCFRLYNRGAKAICFHKFSSSQRTVP